MLFAEISGGVWMYIAETQPAVCVAPHRNQPKKKSRIRKTQLWKAEQTDVNQLWASHIHTQTQKQTVQIASRFMIKQYNIQAVITAAG